ncbi:MAG: methyltransferase domain-containing protein [Betaproteobacteria bacterium]|nr:methyltransferase domain-containing protein [Betaproteobacteria bacterium]
MDIELARANMIESQIRTWEVLDQRVLDLLGEVKREHFVPAAFRNLAFADMEIPLGRGEVMLSPKLEARLLQTLGLKPGDKVLEIGTGSGYQAALLAGMAGHVYSVEIVDDFARSARQTLASCGIRNVTVETANGATGWERNAPYDAILLTGSVPVLPDEFRKQLAVGGRLLAVVGSPPIMTARLVTCIAAGTFTEEGLFETSIPPLRHARAPERFVF